MLVWSPIISFRSLIDIRKLSALVGFGFNFICNEFLGMFYNFLHNSRFKIFFFRLTPPYMLILCVYIGLWKYVGGGPFWPKEGFEIDDCRRTWWSNLLYINNFLNIQYQDHDGVVKGREYVSFIFIHYVIDYIGLIDFK